MELFHVLINFIALAVNVCLVYFSVKLLSVFKGGIMEKSWLFVACGVLTLAIGSLIFSFKYLLDISGFGVHLAGGLLMLLGGIFALMGVYLEYKNWNVPK